MSALALTFCVHEDQQAVARAVAAADPSTLLWYDVAGIDIVTPNRPLILLAVGPEGGAALARWVDAHGLDGVAGVGLVGVTAPFIMPTCCKFHATGGHPADRHGLIDDAARVYGSATERYTNLGPLEPLRGAAERAREGVLCRVCDGVPMIGKAHCACAGANYTYPLRLVVASAPDDGMGKALSSADVALELSGERSLYEGIDDFQATTGGLTVIHYPTRAELDKHGLAAVLKAVGP